MKNCQESQLLKKTTIIYSFQGVKVVIFLRSCNKI